MICRTGICKNVLEILRFFSSSNIWFLLFVTRKELWFEAVKNLDLH